MKKFLAILVLGLLWCNTSFPSYNISGKYYGKGPLKINKNTADILEYYFSGGTKGKYAKDPKRGPMILFGKFRRSSKSCRANES